MIVTAATRPFVLLGDPVAHSLSPIMQNAAMRAAGVDGVFIALRCGQAPVSTLINAFALAGGGGNITVPHKAIAAASIERPTDAVLATGACNTFWLEDGRVCGDNTDVEGFEAAARDLLGNVEGLTACIIGSGGAARAAVHALLRNRGEAMVLGRSSVSLGALTAQFGGDARVRAATRKNPLPRGSFDLLVNATPIGMEGDDALPIDPAEFPDVRAVLDLVYRPGGTALTRAAASRGIPAADGHAMLVAQGAAAFARWWRREAPVHEMRAAIAEA